MNGIDDRKLDELLSEARRFPRDTSGLEEHFETRLMARLAERKQRTLSWQLLIWRMVPGFALVVLILLTCSAALSRTRSGDPFEVMANGHEGLMARSYLTGE